MRTGQGVRNWVVVGVALIGGLAAPPAEAASAVHVARASAAKGSVTRLNGGVEDGTFSPKCLDGSHRTPTTVVDATAYRGRIKANVVRILVPWDIAVNRKSKTFSCFRSYLDHAAGKAKIEVSLNRRGKHADNPSVGAYTKAVDNLARALKSKISYLTAYNEPNNGSYLVQRGAAVKAGQFYLAAHKVFGSKVVAGDFASGVGRSFLNAYAAQVKSVHPAIWALHPYTDVTNFQYDLAAQKNEDPQKAGRKAGSGSKVLQFARLLKTDGYGSSTSIWINEIYVTHLADKNPPSGVPGKKNGTSFSNTNQGYAALFLDGGLGAASLPAAITRAGSGLPRLTRYVYLRATTDDATLPNADVLKVRIRTCVYDALATTTGTLPAQCTK